MSTNQDQEPEQITTTFIELVRDWVEKDDLIKVKRNELKELTDEKKQLETFILDYMDNNNLPLFDISDGKLRRNVSKTKGGLKPELVQECLIKVLNNREKANTTTKFIMDSRPITERVTLKRTFNRKKNST